MYLLWRFGALVLYDHFARTQSEAPLPSYTIFVCHSAGVQYEPFWNKICYIVFWPICFAQRITLYVCCFVKVVFFSFFSNKSFIICMNCKICYIRLVLLSINVVAYCCIAKY
jgi:hypothetical protein